MLKLSIAINLFLILISYTGYSQNGFLGTAGRYMVTIDKSNGHSELSFEINGYPNSVRLDDLVYNPVDSAYYTIVNTTSSPGLARIKNESFEYVGEFNVSGQVVYIAEALAIHPTTNQLYLSASLNGGPSSNDYYSESLLEIDIRNAQGTLFRTFSTGYSNPDMDAITFHGDLLYVSDGQPGSFGRFYEWDIDANNVSLIQNGSYIPVRDLESDGEFIYFSANRALYRWDLTAASPSVVGSTHSSLDYEGELIRGISQIECEPLLADLDSVIFSCEDTVWLYTGLPDGTFEWFNGSTEDSTYVTHSGIYEITVNNGCGVIKDSISVIQYAPASTNFHSSDTTICEGDTIILEMFGNAVDYNWSNGMTYSIIEVYQEGIYWVHGGNECSYVYDTIAVNFAEPIEFNLNANDNVICSPTYTFDPQISDDEKIIWSTGEVSATITVSESGEYWGILSNGCFESSDSVTLEFLTKPEIDLGEDRVLCNEEFHYTISDNNSSIVWHNGSNNPEITISNSQNIWVTIENLCGVDSDTVDITILPRNPKITNVFTPNGDGFNDTFVLDESLIDSSLKVLDRQGRIVYQTSNYKNNWDGYDLPSGVYYYVLTDKCGTSHKGALNIIY